MNNKATDVGLIGIEIYFPSTYVDQTEYEKFNGVPKGKYTIGLGQERMSILNDREDINSISLTVVKNLLHKHSINEKDIGRLEVGTETIIDKSKSAKTVLMNLFKESGNYDIEGATSINACYGSTNALFNSINWMQSSSWDGRYALVVSSDVAVYPPGNARPTGGIGAVAMLLGPNAPIVFDDVRSTFIDHVYDFYKPDPFSEYPTVDGHQSIEIYLNALRQCYHTLRNKNLRVNRKPPSYHDFSYFCFHTPFSKMVQKAFFSLVLEDMKTNPGNHDQKLVSELAKHEFKFNAVTDKLLRKTQINDEWKDKCERSLHLCKNLGNIYTGSLYNGLISLLCDQSIDMSGQKVLLFSYGSGCMASLFSVYVKPGYKQTNVAAKAGYKDRLDTRVKVSPEEYTEWMARREKEFGKKGLVP